MKKTYSSSPFLVITHPELDPFDITEMLRLQPCQTIRAGTTDKRGRKSPETVWKCELSEELSSANLEDQFAFWRAELSARRGALDFLKEKGCEIVLQALIILSKGIIEFVLDPALMISLGSLHVRLEIATMVYEE